MVNVVIFYKMERRKEEAKLTLMRDGGEGGEREGRPVGPNHESKV